MSSLHSTLRQPKHLCLARIVARTGCQQAQALGGDGLACGSPKRFLGQLLGAPRFATLVHRLRQENPALRVASVSRVQKRPGFVESTEADEFSWGQGGLSVGI